MKNSNMLAPVLKKSVTEERGPVECQLLSFLLLTVDDCRRECVVNWEPELAVQCPGLCFANLQETRERIVSLTRASIPSSDS